MYGRGGGIVAGVATTTVAGATVAGVTQLPNTGDSIVGLALASTAITIGALALLSQIIVRIVRKMN